MSRGLDKRVRHLEAFAGLVGLRAVPPSERDQADERSAEADPEARHLCRRLAARLKEMTAADPRGEEWLSGRVDTSPRAAADLARVIVGDREAARLANREARRLAALADQARARPQ